MINATNLLPLLPPTSVSISRIQSGVYVAVVIVGALLISASLLICITSAGRVRKRRQLQAGGLVLWTRKNFELFWSKLTHSTFWMLSILSREWNQTVKSQLNYQEKMKQHCSQSNPNDPFAFRPKFDYYLAKSDWKRECLEMERQVSVEPDRPVKKDQLWRWPLRPENSQVDRNFR